MGVSSFYLSFFIFSFFNFLCLYQGGRWGSLSHNNKTIQLNQKDLDRIVRLYSFLPGEKWVEGDDLSLCLSFKRNYSVFYSLGLGLRE